jgi:hypothetical protein
VAAVTEAVDDLSFGDDAENDALADDDDSIDLGNEGEDW